MRNRHYLLAFTCLLFVVCSFVAIASVPVFMFRTSLEISRDCAAIEITKDVLIEYLESGSGPWPKNWDDLETAFQHQNSLIGERWTFEELRLLVWIRFEQEAPSFGLASGRNVRWSGPNPFVEVEKTRKKQLVKQNP